MIELLNLECNDEKAVDIITKHVNEKILCGVQFYIDTCDMDSSYKRGFARNKCYAHIFPKGFVGSKYQKLLQIADLINSEQIVELSPSDKYILMSCLEDYYEDVEGEYSLERAAEIVTTNSVAKNPSEWDTNTLNIQPIANLEDRCYVIARMAETAAELDRDDAYGMLEWLMRDIEDLKNYAELCFEDIDYEFLGQSTAEELLAIVPEEYDLDVVD